MSRTYTVKSGDILSKISLKYYGSSGRWPEIVQANPQLAGRKTASDGSPLIFPGDLLIIPADSKTGAGQTGASVSRAPVVVLDPEASQDVALFIDGKKFTGFTAYTLVQSVSGVDAFSFSSVWDGSNKRLREAFRPFSYKDCQVFYDGELIFKGVLLPPAPSVDSTSSTISVQGYPLCGVLVDSTLPESLYPAEYSGLDLKAIAETVCAPFGVPVVCECDVGDAFEKVEIDVSDKIWDFLDKLAQQRGVFLSNTAEGALLIYKPEAEAVSASFFEGKVPFEACAAKFDGQKMFSHITGFTKTSEAADSQKFTFENDYLINQGVLRCAGQVVDDVDEGGIEGAVTSLAASMLNKAVSYELSVSGHRDKNGKLYRKNMSLSVLSPGAAIYRETKLIVDSVTLKRSDGEGLSTSFSLSLPGARTGELPEVWPWVE